MSEPLELPDPDLPSSFFADADPAGDFTARPRFAPNDLVPGLSSWRLERKLGGGGFGEVWLVRHEWKSDRRAIKFCTDPAVKHRLVTHEKDVVLRVMRSAEAHPNVVPLVECNLEGETPWLMYEYVEGGTLADAIAQWASRPLPRRLAKAVRTLHAIAGALAQFHRLKPPLVHRDLKPHNVLMAGKTPRITDFGISGATASLEPGNTSINLPTVLHTTGSRRYAPPEQLFGSPPNPRDDVYALGIIAYQMVTADLNAAPGPDALEELRALKLPADFASLIVRSVALNPDRRPKNAKEWEDTLAALMRKKTVAVPVDDPSDDRTDVMELDASGNPIARAVTLGSRGRWYSRPASQSEAEWRLVATTPAMLQITPREVYRFSISSTATERDVDTIIVLAGLTTLTYLNLSFCNGVTDAGLAPLTEFTALRQLYLRECHRITDAGLLHLHGLVALETLELNGCERITPAGVAALQKALPKCKIHR